MYSAKAMLTYGLVLAFAVLIIAATALRGPVSEFARTALAVFVGLVLTYATAIWLGIDFIRHLNG
jgi:hypothetical protein